MRRIVFLLLAGAVALTTASRPATAAQVTGYAVTLSANNSVLDLPATLALTGTVTPAAKGAKVNVQRRVVGGDWAKVASVALTSAGDYRWTTKPTKGGRWEYRVVKPAGAGRSSGVSPVAKVDAYRWRSLLDLPLYQQAGPATTGPVTVDGVRYAIALTLRPAASNVAARSYRTDDRCVRFAGVVGVPDGATSIDPANVFVRSLQRLSNSNGNGINRFLEEIDGDTVPYAVDFGSPYDEYPMIQAALELLTNSSDIPVTFADPRVYCRS